MLISRDPRSLDPLIKGQARADQNGTLAGTPNHFEARLRFSAAMEDVCSARFRHRTSTAREAKGREGEMNKRKLGSFALCGMLLALCFSADAQQTKKIHRIGNLSLASPPSNPSDVDAFRKGLRDLGYIEGQNISIEYRWAEGRYERLPDLATELVRLKVDV